MCRHSAPYCDGPVPLMKRATASSAALLLGLLAACEKAEPVDSPTPSPNASILPAPLASSPQPVESLLPLSQGGPPAAALSAQARSPRGDAGALLLPQPLRADQPPEADTISSRDVA